MFNRMLINIQRGRSISGEIIEYALKRYFRSGISVSFYAIITAGHGLFIDRAASIDKSIKGVFLSINNPILP